jgi:hypothetical protein
MSRDAPQTPAPLGVQEKGLRAWKIQGRIWKEMEKRRIPWRDGGR